MITWLASYPKSGNTWVRLFLSAYKNQGVLDINRPEGYGFDDVEEYFYQTVCPVDIRDLGHSQVILLLPAALLHMIALNHGRDMVVKTHHANAVIDGIHLIPRQLTKRAIYIVRDPRDVAVSWASHVSEDFDKVSEDFGNDKYIITRGTLYHYLGAWNTHVKSWFNEKNFPVIVLKYEDMISEPEAMFKAVIDFLGIAYDEDRFYAALEATTFESLRKQEETYGFKERKGSDYFFRRGVVGGWKDCLSKEQVGRIEERSGEMMEHLGYV